MRSLSRDDVTGFAALGSAGFVSALSIFWIASNRIAEIPPHLSASALLAIQWHAVGLTLAKFGIDYAVFTIVSRNARVGFRPRTALAFPILPVVAGFFAFSLALFDAPVAALLAVAVFLDTLTTILAAELNARRRFLESAAGNLLNYPLFLALWYLAAQRTAPTLGQAVLLFCVSSAVRYAWVAWRASIGQRDASAFDLTVKGWIGAQGALNHFAFRSDQITLALLLFLGVDWVAGSADLSAYVFLSRLPELATGILVLTGTVLFPNRHLAPGIDTGNRAVLGYYAVLAAAILALAAVAAAVALPLFVGKAPTPSWVVPFILQIPLVLLANLVTYSMQSQGHLPGLLRNLLVGSLAGMAVIAAAAMNQSLLLVAWVVPAQLSVFVALGLFAGWGGAIRLFAVGDDR